MTDIKELEIELKKAQDSARKIAEKIEAAKTREAEERMGPLKDLVERAHNCLCQWNHTDGCSWGYEEGSTDKWMGWAHSRWLRHYDKIINGDGYNKPTATLQEIEILITAIEDVKPKVKTAISLLRSGLQP